MHAPVLPFCLTLSDAMDLYLTDDACTPARWAALVPDPVAPSANEARVQAWEHLKHRALARAHLARVPAPFAARFAEEAVALHLSLRCETSQRKLSTPSSPVPPVPPVPPASLAPAASVTPPPVISPAALGAPAALAALAAPSACPLDCCRRCPASGTTSRVVAARPSKNASPRKLHTSELSQLWQPWIPVVVALRSLLPLLRRLGPCRGRT